MKRKLKTVLILITLSLIAIIVFQTYWSINAYKANKKIVGGKIDAAMQQALDSCKRDYFDSIRVVMVKRLSEETTVIKIDSSSQTQAVSGHQPATFSIGTANTPFIIWISFHGSRSNSGFETDRMKFDYYRSKIKHKATIPEIITEMAFYDPRLMNIIINDLMIYDGMTESGIYMSTHHNTLPNSWIPEHTGIYKMPPNYKQADSLKLSNYLKIVLDKIHINADLKIQLASKPTPPKTDKLFYSETNEYKYQYHGFMFLLTHYTLQNRYSFYARAIFRNLQYVVIRSMLTTLTLSALLILFTIFSFYYIIRIINQQKALGELKDDFINNMTHELKTPIATIAVAIEGLQKYNALNDPEKVQRYLQTSRNELNRLNDLVSRVLDVATFESDKIVLVKEKIEVDKLMNELIAAQKSKADKTVYITYNNKDNIGYIVADKLHFSSVILNILDNAVKYAGQPVNVVICLSGRNGMIEFSIADNGIGIPPAHLNRIFEKFYRVPTGNIHDVKGTGLGLSYVKYIVEAHGGTVAVKSEINKGSEFVVSIPA
ncbi:MAG: HAMP domain-containing sensor histidine kinase [Mucilaginibacter sp.]|uniref:sensor histidine kinase n=1 Tax=Mucilaginibacter sp. TaxID=1882438 RepID=UPI0031B2F521